MKIISKVMQGQTTKWCLFAFASLVLGTAEGFCERGLTWWDREKNQCVPCTICNDTIHEAIRVPCELHRDTICQSIYELNIWPFSNDNSETFSSDYDTDYEVVESSEFKWDMQTLAFIVAASGCFVFFIVVLSLTLYHSKQWKLFKQALQTDVEDLSAKLKLMETGTEPAAERIATTDHHIYCNIHVNKDALKASVGKQGFGNVYTEE